MESLVFTEYIEDESKHVVKIEIKANPNGTFSIKYAKMYMGGCSAYPVIDFDIQSERVLTFREIIDIANSLTSQNHGRTPKK